MVRISINIKKADENDLKMLNEGIWGEWERGPSTFYWYFTEDEICYIIEGEADLETDTNEHYHLEAGDIVEIPANLNTKWIIKKYIKKNTISANAF
ncbi:MAG: cupin domain-containing protein [Promethearchaeota archaeon]